MSEDMTYEPVTDVATLRRTAQDARQYALGMEAAANEQAARVVELERALAQADSNMVALAARNAELAARNAELAARLAELEPSGFAMANSALIQRVRELERENAELRAKLDAVPWATLRCTIQVAQDNNPYYGHITDAAMYWLEHNEPKPDADDTDAPLKLAALDEDGDE